MSATKVKLSTNELDLVTNADIILTKNRIIQKVYDLFGNLAIGYVDTTNGLSFIPNEVSISSPKIAKGENYEGLPWVMLDYPRHFTTTDTFAVRTYFWWGNFISITLQLSGKYQDLYQAIIFENLKNSNNDNWYLCCNNDAWQHHFKPSNYKPFSNFNPSELQQLPFIKLAKKIPLQEWDSIEIFLAEGFIEMMQLLQAT